MSEAEFVLEASHLLTGGGVFGTVFTGLCYVVYRLIRRILDDQRAKIDKMGTRLKEQEDLNSTQATELAVMKTKIDTTLKLEGWVRSVDKRLSHIEGRLGLGGPDGEEPP